jgi:hypothetical protein
VHAHTTGTGGNGCTTKVCIINRKQHVEEREFPVATDAGALSTAIGGREDGRSFLYSHPNECLR